MKILTSAQIRELDQYTIANEPVASIDLMERAAKAMTRAITEEWSAQTPVVVFAALVVMAAMPLLWPVCWRSRLSSRRLPINVATT